MSNNTNPLVSVIIPSYQNATLLERSVMSALSQDYENLEVVIVNNGSVDNTRQICEELSERDKRVRWVEIPVNIGPAGARNKGVSESKGELVAFLDADDEWLSEKLRMQVELLTNLENIDLVFTDGFLVDEETGNQRAYSSINKIFARKLDMLPVEQFADVFQLKGRVSEQLYKGNFVSLSTVVVRKSCFVTIGGFDLSCFGMEDLDLWVRLADSCSFAYWFEPQVLCYWRPASLSRMNEQRITQMIHYHERCLVSPEYAHLQQTAYSNLQFYYKHLILHYAQRWMPFDSARVFIRSLRRKFFPLLLVYALLAFLGPIPIWAKLNLINPLLDRLLLRVSVSKEAESTGN